MPKLGQSPQDTVTHSHFHTYVTKPFSDKAGIWPRLTLTGFTAVTWLFPPLLELRGCHAEEGVTQKAKNDPGFTPNSHSDEMFRRT